MSEQGLRWEMTRGARRAVVFLFVLSVALAGSAFWAASREVNGLRAAVISSCQFSSDIGGAPVTVPRGGRPSRLGISIVADARREWQGLHCPGRLPPPAPSFARWARYYHLPVSR